MVVASATGAISTARPVASASAWTKVGLRLIPPSTRRVPIVRPVSASAASQVAQRWAMS